MSEKIVRSDEATQWIIAIEAMCDALYSRSIAFLGPSTESVSIEIEVPPFIPGEKSMIDLEIGYDIGATLNPSTSQRLDRAGIILGSSLNYLAIVLDEIRERIYGNGREMAPINLDSVTIDSSDVLQYDTEFERDENEVVRSEESGMQFGKYVLHDYLVGKADKRRIRQFMENPTLGREVTVPTVVD